MDGSMKIEGKLAWVLFATDRRKWVGYRQVMIAKVDRNRKGEITSVSARAYNAGADRYNGRLFKLRKEEWSGDGRGFVFRGKLKPIE